MDPSPPHLPAAWMIDRDLDSQYGSLLIVHFDRVFLDPVFDSGAFDADFEAALDLAIETDPTL